ncbi:plasmid replication protein, CyRepA1 family [Pseudanabaena sp. 'Roaring Creek']|uniref:plasmid replication protein, CyRepA1 family n=1 Tax=Pseudanabaena sp. 'Roaring Creek' TaxID=1681830 RepID=UPI0006D7F1AE|nr:plasmid replication protein, CyRepA1 family [Pseudanabaena sp. 'Roaring Creek']
MKSTTLDLRLFSELVYREWIDGSTVEPELFTANVEIIADEIIESGGEVNYPIHEALNWNPAKWRTVWQSGKQQRPELFGALIHSWNPILEKPEVFQVKLSNPLIDHKKGKPRKYENPVKRGQVGGFALVPQSIWKKVADRYGVEVDFSALPDSANFWAWVATHPQIPIFICEGMKKACCLLSQGYVAIALSGITMGRIQGTDGKLALQPYLAMFANPKRQVLFCFDAETKEKTKHDVFLATVKTGKLFADADCLVKVIELPLLEGTDKTGVDDFIVERGIDAFHQVYLAAISLNTYAWEHQQDCQLTFKPSRNLSMNLLFQLDQYQIPDYIPKTGIVALQSAKGTGKTKAIAAIVAGTDKLALLGHRVSLVRNLCKVMNADFKGDLDMADGQFITDSAYSARVGACVDSLLAFDPRQFVDCDLVIDEVEQVLRHLISGSTCNKDGKRSALLARLHILVKVARRVIVADADLSDISLNYLQALRGDGADVFLIKNEFQPEGYPARFIVANNDVPIIQELLADVTRGNRVFVATDSKSSSKAIAKLVEKIRAIRPKIRVLLFNSDTSGGRHETDFMSNINKRVFNYDVIIATPSMSTGVSIEVKRFHKVYGLFYGTVTDADASQALSRVRDNVPRTVWCAERGINFCKIDRSSSPMHLKNTLRNRWDREVSLIRAGLGDSLLPIVDHASLDNPHIDLWASVEARTNAAMWSLRDYLLERLVFEGNQVTVVTIGNDDSGKSIKEALAQTRQERYQAVSRAKILSPSEQKKLISNESQSYQDLLDLEKTAIAKFYCLNQVSPELVEYDRDGQRRSEILKLEALFQSDLAIESDVRAFTRQAKFGMGIFLPDQPCNELGRYIRSGLGLKELLNPEVQYTDADLEDLGSLCRQFATDIKRYLGFNVPQDATNIWIFRILCNQLGIKICSKRIHGDEGMINVCWLDAEAWQELLAILERRSVSRQQVTAAQPVSCDRPPLITNDSEGAIARNGKFAIWTRLIATVTYLRHLLTSDISPYHPLYKLKKQLSVLFFNFQVMFNSKLFLTCSQVIP